MVRLLKIQSFDHLVRVLELIILRTRKESSYSTAFRFLTGTKLLDVLHSYGVQGIQHLARLEPKKFKMEKGFAVRVDGRHSEFSQSGLFRHDRLARRCNFYYTTAELTAQYRALQESVRAKAEEENERSKRVEDANAQEVEEADGEKDKPVSSPKFAEEPTTSEESSINGITEVLLAPVDADVIEKNEKIEEADRVDEVADLILSEMLERVDLENIDDFSYCGAVVVHNADEEGIDEFFVSETVTFEVTIDEESIDERIAPVEIDMPVNSKEERAVGDGSPSEADALGMNDEKIEGASSQDEGPAPVVAEVHEQEDVDRLGDVAALEEEEELKVAEERLLTNDDRVVPADVSVELNEEVESADDGIAPVEMDVPMNVDEERIVNGANAILEADDLETAGVFRVELRESDFLSVLHQDKKIFRLGDSTSVEDNKENRFDDSLTLPDIKVTLHVVDDKFLLPNCSLVPTRPDVPQDDQSASVSTIPSDPSLHSPPSTTSPSESRYSFSQSVQLSTHLYITSTSPSTENTSIQEEEEDGGRRNTDTTALQQHTRSSELRVPQSENIPDSLTSISLVQNLGPNVGHFIKIGRTNERVAILTFFYDFDIFYIRPVSYQSYYISFAKGLLEAHKDVAEEQRILKESEKIEEKKNRWAVGDFACYVQLGETRPSMWYEVPENDNTITWNELLDCYEKREEDKAYRVRILSVRYGINGLEYDVYSLDCGFISRSVPYESILRIDPEFLRFNKEGSIWMPEPLCSPCTRRHDHKMSFLHECHFTLPPAIHKREIDTEVAVADLEEDSPLGFTLTDMRRRNILL